MLIAEYTKSSYITLKKSALMVEVIEEEAPPAEEPLAEENPLLSAS